MQGQRGGGVRYDATIPDSLMKKAGKGDERAIRQIARLSARNTRLFGMGSA